MSPLSSVQAMLPLLPDEPNSRSSYANHSSSVSERTCKCSICVYLGWIRKTNLIENGDPYCTLLSSSLTFACSERGSFSSSKIVSIFCKESRNFLREVHAHFCNEVWTGCAVASPMQRVNLLCQHNDDAMHSCHNDHPGHVQCLESNSFSMQITFKKIVDMMQICQIVLS